MQKHSSVTNIAAIFFAIASSALIGACASTTTVQDKNYSWDAYQYHLSESQVESINQNLPGATLKNSTTTPTTILLSKSDYWKFVTNIGSSPFFSDYEYSFTKCERESSGALLEKTPQQTQACSANYFESASLSDNSQIKITATQLQNQKISLVVTSLESEIAATQQLDYDTSKDFLLIYQKLPQDNRLLIINHNLLGIPWSYYKKTPQSTAN